MPHRIVLSPEVVGNVLLGDAAVCTAAILSALLLLASTLPFR